MHNDPLNNAQRKTCNVNFKVFALKFCKTNSNAVYVSKKKKNIQGDADIKWGIFDSLSYIKLLLLLEVNSF